LRNKVFALFGAAVLLFTLAACSTRAPADEIVLYYKAGAGDNKKFDQCIEPGTKGPGPVDDQIFYLPTSVRTWKVEPGSGDFDGYFYIGSAPDAKTGQAGLQMKVRTTIDFYLNTYCGEPDKDGAHKDATSPVVQFWEKTGRRYGVATDGEGGFKVDKWKDVLKDTMHVVEEGILQEQGRKYDDDALDTNLNDIWATMEQDMSAKFNEQVRKKVGGDYFCGLEFVRTKPDCPPVFVDILGIDFADDGIQVARNDVYKAVKEGEADLARARAELEKANLLAQANRNPNYLEFAKLEAAKEIAQLNLEAAKACAANPNCTVIVGVSGGAELGINTGK
jgi:hypothetical protein